MTVEIAPMAPADLLAIDRQPSQLVQLGIAHRPTLEEASAIAASGEAWTVRDGDRIVACVGLTETFPGRQATAWALLAGTVGAAHLALTRFARRRIAASRLLRIEAVVHANEPAACAWARLVGLTPAAVLRCYGAASVTHILYERIAA